VKDDDNDDVSDNYNLICSTQHKYLVASSEALVEFSNAEMTKDVIKCFVFQNLIGNTLDQYLLIDFIAGFIILSA
jgi:hypothetical protein